MALCLAVTGGGPTADAGACGIGWQARASEHAKPTTRIKRDGHTETHSAGNCDAAAIAPVCGKGRKRNITKTVRTRRQPWECWDRLRRCNRLELSVNFRPLRPWSVNRGLTRVESEES